MAAGHENFALYLDTSALVKLFVEEDGSAQVRTLAKGRANAAALLVSRLGYTEASVSLARMVHLGRVLAADLSRLLAGFPPQYGPREPRPLRGRWSVACEASCRSVRHRVLEHGLEKGPGEGERSADDVTSPRLRGKRSDAGLVQAARTLGFAIPR